MAHTVPGKPTDDPEPNPTFDCPYCGEANYQEGNSFILRTDYLVFCDKHCLCEWIELQITNEGGAHIDDVEIAKEAIEENRNLCDWIGDVHE